VKYDFWASFGVQSQFGLMTGAYIVLAGFAIHSFRSHFNADYYRKVFMQMPMERASSLFLYFVLSFYTAIIAQVMTPFNCFKQTDGTYTLVSYPSLNCFDSIWNSNLGLIVFSLIQTLAIPSYFVYIFWQNRNSEDRKKPSFLARYGLLTSPYNDDFYWWELVIVAKKTLFVVIIVADAGRNVYLRSFLLILLLVAMSVAEGYLRPHKGGTFTLFLYQLWTVLQIVWLAAKCMIFRSAAETPEDLQAGIVIFLIMAFVFLTVSMLANQAYSWYGNFRFEEDLKMMKIDSGDGPSRRVNVSVPASPRSHLREIDFEVNPSLLRTGSTTH